MRAPDESAPRVDVFEPLRRRAHESPPGSRRAFDPAASSIPAACTRGSDRCRPTSPPSSSHDPHIAVVGEDPPHLRALRLLHRDLPDLPAARRRARQPARPHLPDQGHAGERQARDRREVVKHIDRCLSCLSCMTTCPSGVHYMHLVDHARAYIEADLPAAAGRPRAARAARAPCCPIRAASASRLRRRCWRSRCGRCSRRLPVLGARLGAMLDLAPARAAVALAA